MKSNGKPSTCYSDNPKMGKPYTSQGKGYAEGGYVPEEDEMQPPRPKEPAAAVIGEETNPKPTRLGNKRELFRYRKES